jgi:hypothetical protein
LSEELFAKAVKNLTIELRPLFAPIEFKKTTYTAPLIKNKEGFVCNHFSIFPFFQWCQKAHVASVFNQFGPGRVFAPK